MGFHNLSVKAKLFASFVLLAVMVLAVSAVSLSALSREHTAFSDYVNSTAVRMSIANSVLDAANGRAIGVRNLVLVSKQSDIDLEKAATTQAHGRVGELMSKLKGAIDSDPGVTAQEKGLYQELAAVEAKYVPVALSILGKALKGDKEGAMSEMDSSCRPLLAALIKAADAYIAFVAAEAKQEVRSSDTSFAANRALLVVASLVAMGAAVGLAILLTRGIVGPIKQAVMVAETVAAGDLRSEIDVSRRDELGALLGALKRMNDSLVDIVGSVRQGSDSIATGSAQIASGNADLSARTEQQASSLQETAASMEQMTATVRNSAESAQQATQLAGEASAAAEKGGEAVSLVVSTMQQISESSRRIGEIISVIDGISFQTNILALNAAVEAARAGEQGRGFAVVAAEVRSLAQRSSEAAKQIKGLIEASVGTVETGALQVTEARATMDDIVAKVRRVSGLNTEIGQAAVEQHAGIGQVNAAVAHLDQATQQNAALVEESAAAAASLNGQAVRLAEAVSVFKLRGA